MTGSKARTRKYRISPSRKGASITARSADSELIGALDLLRERRAPYDDVLASIVHDTLTKFPPPPTGPVVELGAGTGQLSAWLSPDVRVRTVHTDPSEQALRRLMERDKSAITKVASAESLPFADASIATVLGLCVFDAVLDEAATVSEIHRVLCPGGRFVHFLDMATLLERPFAQLAKAGMVPIPNVFSDPAEHEWPLDIVLLPREWLAGILSLTSRAAHPLYTGFGGYFELFFSQSFQPERATKLFKAIGSSSVQRSSLLTLLGSAGQLASDYGYPAPQALPFHSARYLLSVLETAFAQSGAFEIDLAGIVSRSMWRASLPGEQAKYRSLCVGHQRISRDIPENLVGRTIKRDEIVIGTDGSQTFVEAGMFVFVARRLSK